MRLRLLLITPLVLLICLRPGSPSSARASVPMFGSGSDGVRTFTSNAQLVPPVYAAVASASAGGSSLAISGMVAEPPLTEFVPGQLILIHQTRGGSAGTWELAQVQSYALGNVFTVDPLVNSYSSAGSDRAQVLVVPQYTDVTVNVGVTVSAIPWNGSTGGVIAILANGTMTVAGAVSGTATGYEGGPAVGSNTNAYAGGSQCRAPFQVTPSDSGGCNGGRGDRNFTGAAGAGGGGGANGTAGGQGWAGGGQPGPLGGDPSGTPDLTVATLGGGGASGSGGNSGSSGAGGRGGGIIFVGALALNVTGSIGSDGANGDKQTGNDPHLPPGNGYSGGGGGGGGGSVLVRTGTGAFGGGVLAARGGYGGQGSDGAGGVPPGGNGSDNGGGGAGGAGRIRVEYCTSISGGTADPPASVAQIPCGPADSDGDGIPDAYENVHLCLNPNIADALADPDADLLTNIDEYARGTDPCDSDTDADGYPDGQEVALGENPLGYCAIMRADVDGDGTVSIVDLSLVAGQFLESVPPADARYDQGPPPFDHQITIVDLSNMASEFLNSVSSCP
jgi:hypothetical protein